MGFKCGIVGLPNVGKSTLFNALTKTAAAQAANYPFCTIEPNVGRVGVPDSRLTALADIAGSKEIIPTQLEFVDIAGLVKGASKGEGLGNQFLGHIRQVDAVLHLLRCFENDDITHTEGSVDPIRDRDVIETELLLADLETLTKQAKALDKKARGNDKDAKESLTVAQKILTALEAGSPARKVDLDADEKTLAKSFGLLTDKPVLYVCNVDEDSAATGNELSAKIEKVAADEGHQCVIISAEIEQQISVLETVEEQNEYLETLGLSETGLARVIRKGYDLLNLITFFTVGPKEAHAWTVKSGSFGPQAAGVIHTDFEKGYIRAEVIAYQDYIDCKGESGARAAGKLRTEGKDYPMVDGDVVHFLFNT